MSENYNVFMSVVVNVSETKAIYNIAYLYISIATYIPMDFSKAFDPIDSESADVKSGRVDLPNFLTRWITSLCQNVGIE